MTTQYKEYTLLTPTHTTYVYDSQNNLRAFAGTIQEAKDLIDNNQLKQQCRIKLTNQ